MTPAFQSARRLIPATLFLLAAAGTVYAGTPQAQADAQARFRAEMAQCNSGQSSQPVNVCRTEARNALAESRRGGLTDASDQYTRNAVLRCAEFQGAERSACEDRVFSPSRVEGSVDGGGILRESVIVVPAK